MGIEPTPSAWKAEVLPLNYTRLIFKNNRRTTNPYIIMVHNSFAPRQHEPDARLLFGVQKS